MKGNHVVNGNPSKRLGAAASSKVNEVCVGAAASIVNKGDGGNAASTVKKGVRVAAVSQGNKVARGAGASQVKKGVAGASSSQVKKVVAGASGSQVNKGVAGAGGSNRGEKVGVAATSKKKKNSKPLKAKAVTTEPPMNIADNEEPPVNLGDNDHGHGAAQAEPGTSSERMIAPPKSMTRKDGASSSFVPVRDNTKNRPTTRSLSQGQVEAQLAPPPIPPGHAGYRRSGVLSILGRKDWVTESQIKKNAETSRKVKEKVTAPKKLKKGLDANTDQ
ncbi:hypothetical protein ACFE04_026562 [Oxalis oulophora]